MAKKRILAALTALCLPAGMLAAWHFWPKPEPEYKSYLRQAGYLPLAQPSRLFPPGSIGTLETLHNGSLVLHSTCTMDRDHLGKLAETSGTVDNSFNRKVANSIIASSQAIAAAMAKGKGERTTSFTLSMKNMQIISMADDNLMNVRRTYLKDSCEQAVIWNLHAGAKVCQTGEVLQADLDYDAASTETLNADQRVRLAKELSENAGLSLNSMSKDQMQGRNLYFGIKIGLRCFQLKDMAPKVANAL